MIYEQAPPFSLQIELCEGCNLACSFCGINGIRDKPGKVYKTMTEETLVSLMTQVRELGWNPRCEFAMHGEPTMHPDYARMIEIAYTIHPRLQLMMTTNGGGLIRGEGAYSNITKLFHNGLDILALDDYDGVKIIGKIRPHLEEICHDLAIDLFEYPRDPGGNPHRRVSGPFITVIEDISRSGSGTHSHLSNHSGSAAPLSFEQAGKRCHRPFRELSVRWDGNVALCCDDWTGKYHCGNIRDGLLKVWHSKEFDAARRMLVQGRREFAPCYGCTAKSYRVGLLPDKLGRDTMDEPDDNSAAVIEEALKKTPLSSRVPRPWDNQ